jgi:hypothetical protein
MSISSSQAQILLSAGIACVVAAIVGGGITFKDFAIPKILSQKRQLLLGGFGALLILTAIGFISGVVANVNPGLAFTIVIVTLMFYGLIESGERRQKYKKLFIAHLDSPEQLVEDARKAFWEGDNFNSKYRWTISYVSQARAAARNDGWESGWAFLLGAQLALRQRDAARATRIDIIDSVKKAANDNAGYFSSPENLRQLASNLVAIRMEIAKDGMAKSVVAPIRAEIDLVFQAVNDIMHPGQ